MSLCFRLKGDEQQAATKRVSRVGNSCCVVGAKPTVVDYEIFCQVGGVWGVWGGLSVLQIEEKSSATISWLRGRKSL